MQLMTNSIGNGEFLVRPVNSIFLYTGSFSLSFRTAGSRTSVIFNSRLWVLPMLTKKLILTGPRRPEHTSTVNLNWKTCVFCPGKFPQTDSPSWYQVPHKMAPPPQLFGPRPWTLECCVVRCRVCGGTQRPLYSQNCLRLFFHEWVLALDPGHWELNSSFLERLQRSICLEAFIFWSLLLWCPGSMGNSAGVAMARLLAPVNAGVALYIIAWGGKLRAVIPARLPASHWPPLVWNTTLLSDTPVCTTSLSILAAFGKVRKKFLTSQMYQHF